MNMNALFTRFGGLLFIVGHGAGRYSLDARIAAKRASRAEKSDSRSQPVAQFHDDLVTQRNIPRLFEQVTETLQAR